MKAAGIGDTVPFIVNALAGALAAAACAWLGRRMFGRLPGLIAGLLLAVSMFAVSYSRLALAEPLFLLMWLLVLSLLWRAAEDPRAWRWAALGAGAGLLMLAKYSGVVIMGIGATWVALQAATMFTRARKLPRGLIAGFACAALAGAGIALAGFMTVNPGGLGRAMSVLSSSSGYRAGSGEFRFLTTPEILAHYLALWVSPIVLASAALGACVALWKRSAGDMLVLVWTVVFAAALLVYKPFPRLALPLFPAVFLLAARGIDAAVWAAQRVTRGTPAARKAVPAFAVLLVGAAVVAEAARLPRILRMETTGYARAVRAAERAAAGAEVWWRVQPEAVVALYTNAGRELADLSDGASWRRPVRRVFVVDHSEYDWHGEVAAFLDGNRTRLKLIESIPNPMYDELYFQPASIEALKAFPRRPRLVPMIAIYESTEGLEPLRR